MGLEKANPRTNFFENFKISTRCAATYKCAYDDYRNIEIFKN